MKRDINETYFSIFEYLEFDLLKFILSQHVEILNPVLNNTKHQNGIKCTKL